MAYMPGEDAASKSRPPALPRPGIPQEENPSESSLCCPKSGWAQVTALATNVPGAEVESVLGSVHSWKLPGDQTHQVLLRSLFWSVLDCTPNPITPGLPFLFLFCRRELYRSFSGISWDTLVVQEIGRNPPLLAQT